MTLILVLILSTLNLAFSFDGKIIYEVNDSKNVNKEKQEARLGIKKNLMFLDLGKIVDNEFVSSIKVITNFDTKKFTVLSRNLVTKHDFQAPYSEKEFIAPEETISLKTKKSILNYETEEFESFYFALKTRLPLNAWYAAGLDMQNNGHVWHLYKLSPDFIFLNYLINPVTRKIALELNTQRGDKSKVSMKAKKVERIDLPENDFETFSGEGYLHYEAYNSFTPKKLFYLTIALKNDLVRFNISDKPSNSSELRRSIVYNFNSNTFTGQFKKDIAHEPILEKTNKPNFSLPLEVKSKNNKKTVLGMTAVEYEASYKDGKNVVTSTMWYTPKLFAYFFYPAQNLYDITPDLGLFNLFIHPQTKEIALEASLKMTNGSINTFKCVKWEKTSVPSTYFNIGDKKVR